MLGNHQIYVDEWAEVYDLLRPYADHSFWQWPTTLDPRVTYIVGRVLLKENWQAIVDWATKHPGRIIFSNPAEGSETILLQLRRLRITDYIRDKLIGLLTSGDLEPGITYCKTDCYFSNIVEYEENIQAHATVADPEYLRVNKPYEFVMLTGRLRPHRKYMLDALGAKGLLKNALYTCLGSEVEMGWTSALTVPSTEPIRLLPPEYEIARAVDNLTSVADSGFVKHELFGNTWGDAIVNPRVYEDTHFSVVTETIYDYAHSFRTEKIWKPMIMCHPFVAVANRGYYRDLHRAGFRTFSHVIDESFDGIDDAQARADRTVAVIADIVANGAGAFARAVADVCAYNYEHLQEHNQREREALPRALAEYLDRLIV
jgi:hypothetical protein